MSSQDFKIVVNSSVNGTVLNTTSYMSYSFDFTQFKDGFYEVTFSFCSTGENDVDPSNPIELRVNFNGANGACYTTNALYKVGTVKTTHLGILYPQQLSASTGFIQASFQDNIPTVIQKPMNFETFTVSLIDPTTNTFWIDNLATALTNYLLVLNFKKIHSNI